MNANESVAWKAYDEVHFSDQYILRWVREGDEYVNRISKEMMEDLHAVVRQQEKELGEAGGMIGVLREKVCQQQAEIETLKSLNALMKDAIEKRIEMDATRYQWLRAEFAAGRETYLAEGIPSGEELDKYIDGKTQK